MNDTPDLKLLFVINPGSGSDKTDWPLQIREYFASFNHNIELFELPDPCDLFKIKQKIGECHPDKVFAVGGDGTVKLVAECLLSTGIPLGILPAGSANGLAKELGIPEEPAKALEVAEKGHTRKIHVVSINDELCIHLSDIGFNAFIVKKFETGESRGIWGYIKAAWKVLWLQPYMQVNIKTGEENISRKAAMIVVANATKYGTGALINPDGRLDDDVFEVIVIKKISVSEIFKMMVTHLSYDPGKTEVFHTSSLLMQSRRKAHFQVDGQYLGKVNTIKASITPNALEMIVPLPV